MPRTTRIAFGDIHNHNAHGYGIGSIERSVENARSHLDFFAFTGHSSWHDLGEYGGRAKHFTDGFRTLKETWPRVQRVIADSNRDGEFCSFLGFEWHSNRFGDQCVVFPEDFRPLHYASELGELRRFCVANGALLIPHHLAYPQGRRGANWDSFTSECTPVVEVYSWHGNGEEDRGPFPYLSGSPGGRDSRNTVRAGLARGLKFGFVASSDNHSGFPGAYGEGLMAALVTDLTRPAILEAIRARRTYALTGDRIEIDFRIDDRIMGSDIAAGREVELYYDVQGRDELECVDVIVNGRNVAKDWPGPFPGEPFAGGPGTQVRFEWGWGPWGGLGAEQITDWEFRVSLSSGEILGAFPCFSSTPFDEHRRHALSRLDARSLRISSFSSRKDSYAGNPNQSVVLKLDTPPGASIRIERLAPGREKHDIELAMLACATHPMKVGPLPAESYQLHRLVRLNESAMTRRRILPVGDEPTSVYIRVTQRNGHMAWSSPVFINYPA